MAEVRSSSSGKIAFIASGGGMSCAYSAGVAWAFEEFGIRPDIILGSSGSAGTVSYFASGEAKRAVDLWLEEVTNPKVLRRQPLHLDVDFIIDSMRDRFPFHETQLRSPSVDLFLAVTDSTTLRPVFLSNHGDHDWYEVMRASMAIPFVYDKEVVINGTSYIDGDLSASLHEMVNRAVDAGATTIYLCNTKLFALRDVFSLAPQINWRSLRRVIVSLLRKCTQRQRSTHHIDLIKMRPSRLLKTGVINNSREVIGDAVNLGYSDAMNFLNTKKMSHL